MKSMLKHLIISISILAICLTGFVGDRTGVRAGRKDDHADYLTFLDVEPVSMDPQCISENYTGPLNIFDRLVEVSHEKDSNELIPSLAESWELSEDGWVYTFHLRKNVYFSNGEPLTSEDVEYTIQRLLTHPDSRNRDIVMSVAGAEDLRAGRTGRLVGFRKIDDYSFSIILNHPCASFLAGLSTPGASILDKETTQKAGDSFGKRPETTIGTGPFILKEWTANKEIRMEANKKCWAGPPKCAGLKMQFYKENAPLRDMYLGGELDILDMDKLGMDAEYFLHGDIYRKKLIRGPRVGISYIALNESLKPLNDVRVRKALQLSLDRETILQASIGGRGVLENGIFPHGLNGFNPQLPEIEYNPEKARRLLAEAGYADGFDLEICYSTSSSQSVKDVLLLAASMWKKIGVNPVLTGLDDKKFMNRRRNGSLACYTGTWSADYNDPDNFIYTFFGSPENTLSRSLCYPDRKVMRRVQDARAIVDEEERIREYQDLEKKIIQEDAAWIPLYSKLHFFLVSDRVEGFEVRWNGWSSNRYSEVSLKKDNK